MSVSVFVCMCVCIHVFMSHIGRTGDVTVLATHVRRSVGESLFVPTHVCFTPWHIDSIALRAETCPLAVYIDAIQQCLSQYDSLTLACVRTK